MNLKAELVHVSRRIAALVSLMLAAAPFASIAAAANVDAKAILARWRAAIGAPAASAAVTALTASTHEGPLSGTERIVVARDGRFRKTDESNGDHTEIVVDGAQGWSRDWSGDVVQLQGAALQRARTEALVDAALVLGPPAALPEAAIHSDPARDGFVATLTGGGIAPFSVDLDARTGLPVRIERPAEGGRVVDTPHDWRSVGARRVPSTIVETGGSHRAPLTVTVRAVDDGVAPGAFQRPAAGPSDVVFTGTHAVRGIPFDFETSHIMIAGRINKSAPAALLLDTGAPQSDVNTRHLAEYGIMPYGSTGVTGGGNSADYAFARNVTFALAGVELRNQHVGVLDSGGLERVYGVKLGGLLGYDFYSRFVVEADYQAKVLNLYDPRNYTYRGNGYVVPFTIEDGLLYTDGTITVAGQPPIRAHLIIDSGAADTMNFTSPFVREHRLVEAAAADRSVFRTPGTGTEYFAQSNVRGRIERLQLGKLTMQNIPVNFSVATSGAYSDASFAGVIGESIMRRFKVIFDYSRHHMILEPTAETDKPFAECRTFGLTALASGADLHTYTVSAVRAQSPAERAGFARNDVVTVLDGKPASAFTLGDLRTALADRANIMR